MTQSRAHSLVEAVANTAVGFVISMVLTFLMFPQLSASQGVVITSIFTAASIVRGYAMRRLFERFRRGN